LAAMKKETFRLVWSAAPAFQKNDASQLSLKFSPTPEHSGELLKNFRTLAAERRGDAVGEQAEGREMKNAVGDF
jgi:hypothetical protein